MTIDPDSRPECPSCVVGHVVLNGKDRAGKQQFRCVDCGKRFVGRTKIRPACPYCGQAQEVSKADRNDYIKLPLTCHRCGAQFAQAPAKTGLVCRGCGSTRVVRNGKERSGSQKLLCRDCGLRFVEAPKKGPVDLRRKNVVHGCLTHDDDENRCSIREIARYANVSRGWLRRYLKGDYEKDFPPES